jgi:hypothetical protein
VDVKNEVQNADSAQTLFLYPSPPLPEGRPCDRSPVAVRLESNNEIGSQGGIENDYSQPAELVMA